MLEARVCSCVCQHGDCAQICEWLLEVLLAKQGGPSRVDRISNTKHPSMRTSSLTSASGISVNK